ncbi:MAG: cytochrome c4 [Paucibacter sp.]|nr:cytochrome c4 [Roseateles sp.]
MKTAACLFSGFLLFATMSAHADEAAAKADLAKGGEVAGKVCFTCHTTDGSRGTATYPILQGQHADYLVKQLHDFKGGKRKGTVMPAMAAPLSEDDIRNVAAFYASKTAKPGAAHDKNLVELGQKIYRGGIPDRSIAACAGCHSPDGAGIPVQYPRIGGQQAEYVASQLTAFRSGERGNNPTMAAIAAKMNDQEIKAVSDYVAGLR